LDEGDNHIIKRNMTYVFKNYFFSTVIGLGLNTQLKNIPKFNFLRKPLPLRLACRLPLLALPYFAYFKWKIDEP